jgi:hypothetical protein
MGKSQTIANVIASLNASGQSVLFVAEKRTALQAVLQRLQRVGLDKLAIDLHGADVSPRRVVEQIAAALDAVWHCVPVDCDDMHQRYVERHHRLNRHVERLRRKCTRGGLQIRLHRRRPRREIPSALTRLEPGDKLFAYMRGLGYVAYGQVTKEAMPVQDFLVDPEGKPLLQLPLTARSRE